MISGSRIKRMVAKEFRQFFRDKLMLGLSIMIPILQTLILSYAVNTDAVNVPTVVCDMDRTRVSRDFLASVTSSVAFAVIGEELSVHDVERVLDRGGAELALYIPSGFSRDLQHGDAQVLILVNGADSITATVASAYLIQAAASYDVEVKRETILRQGYRADALPSVRGETRVFYNPDLRSLWFMGPGIMAILLLVLLQSFAAFSISKEKELGTFEQMVITPIRPTEMLLGKIIPYSLIGALDAAAIGGVVVWVLGVPVRGSILVLAAAMALFILATLGSGLLLSAASANQQQAQMLNLFLAFPSILLSGFMFPRENLPLVFLWISDVIPMTYLLRIIRGVFLKGTGFAELWLPNLLPLAVLSVIFFVLGVMRFHKRLD
ncbi:MAG: ABC transporter permease [Armatimonadetes bacterium]|jgi:ABC-2 type transport system permease protein|nr:ABC transporter permease [Armatimonadota bacterium]NLN90157.1 ABC transporter permease [candidate division WS1 bacterium]